MRKTILLLLLLAASNAGAQFNYDVKTDNPLRTFSGGATNLPLLNATNRFTGPLQLPSVTAGRVPIIDAGGNLTNSAVTPTALGYLDATSSVQTQLDSKPTVALTNLALLNGTNVFTGTTNIFAGNLMSTGFANFSRTIVLFETNNFFFPDLATNGQGLAGGNTTNTATNIWLNTANYIPSNIFTVTLPAVNYTNASVSILYDLEYTNSRPSASYGIVVSAGTNRVQIVPIGSTGASWPYYRIFSSTASLIANQGSTTNQLAANAGPPLSSFVVSSQSYIPASYVDTSAPWDMTFEWGAQIANTGALTNTFCRRFQVIVTLPADTRVSQ
jgi:hypothetical protein